MIVRRLVHFWVALYTLGVPEPSRTDRRAEIESDVWEHELAAGSTMHTERAIAGRCVRGAPADLGWRLAQRTGRRRHGDGRGRVTIAFVVATAALVTLMAVGAIGLLAFLVVAAALAASHARTS